MRVGLPAMSGSWREDPRTPLHRLSFRLLAVAVSAAFLWVTAPYAGAILWSIVFAILFTLPQSVDLGRQVPQLTITGPRSPLLLLAA
jgi:hypothetical protein